MGAVGLAALMAAKSEGVQNIIAIDMMNSKLEIALTLGATHAINTVEQLDLLSALAAAGGADQIVDTTGAAKMIEQGVSALNHGGIMALIGTPKSDTPVEVDPLDMLMSSKSILGIVEGRCHSSEVSRHFIQATVAAELC